MGIITGLVVLFLASAALQASFGILGITATLLQCFAVWIVLLVFSMIFKES